MSIFASLAAPGDHEHADDCAIWHKGGDTRFLTREPQKKTLRRRIREWLDG